MTGRAMLAARRLWAAPAFRRWATASVLAAVTAAGVDMPEEVATVLLGVLLGVLGVPDHRDTVAAAEGAVAAAVPDMSAGDIDDGGRR